MVELPWTYCHKDRPKCWYLCSYLQVVMLFFQKAWMFMGTADRISDLEWLWAASILHYWKPVCFVFLVSSLQKLTGLCYMDGPAVCKTSVTEIKLTFCTKLHKYLLLRAILIRVTLLLGIERFFKIKIWWWGVGLLVFYGFSAAWQIPCSAVECVYVVLNTHTHTHWDI